MFGRRSGFVKVTMVTSTAVHLVRTMITLQAMSTANPRDVVEGGPERSPSGQDEPEEPTPKRADAEIEPDGEHALDAPSHHSDDPWYQPESGSLGPD
jgi:hypothetical protein